MVALCFENFDFMVRNVFFHLCLPKSLLYLCQCFSKWDLWILDFPFGSDKVSKSHCSLSHGPGQRDHFHKKVCLNFTIYKKLSWEEKEGSFNVLLAQALRGIVFGKQPKHKPHPGAPRCDRKGLWLLKNIA